MLRLLLPFIAGIILAIFIPLPVTIVVIATLVALLVLLVFYLVQDKRYQNSKIWLTGIAITIFFFLLGNLAFIAQKEKHKPDSHIIENRAYDCLAVVIEDPSEKARSFKTILELRYLKNNSEILNPNFKILAYFAKDSLASKLRYGDQLVFHGILFPVESPKNPGQFNYKRYLANNFIYYQVYIKSGQWKNSGEEPGFSFKHWASKTRKHFLEIFRSNGMAGDEYKVASALILGQSDNLDSETLQEYSGAGVIHILSVSGLHVGVIYLVLNLLLGFMDRNKKLLFLKTLILLFVIWYYSLVTGFAPAVCRAAAMLTFISLGKLLQRRVHPINTISVSAFVVLLIDPSVITNIGFQLSYIAVGGIILMYDGIYQAWSPRFRVTDMLWRMTALSLAAQIATAPLSVYYFHQFPIYFLPANLVAIPLSSLAIYSGLITLATSVFHPVSSLFGWITSFSVKLLNGSVAFIESLPGAVWAKIHFPVIEMLLLYAFLSFILIYLATKNRNLIIASLILLLICAADSTRFAIKTNLQKRIVIYSINNFSAIGFQNSTIELLVADSSLFQNQQIQDYHLKNSLAEYGIKRRNLMLSSLLFNENHSNDLKLPGLINNGNGISFFNKKMVILDKDLPMVDFERRIETNILLITHHPGIKIAEILRIINPQVIVFDESNPDWQVRKWLSECEEMEINAYSTHEKGAFILEVE